MNIDQVRKIVEECQRGKVDGVMVDLFTASTVLQVWEHLKEANKKRFEELPIRTAAQIAFRLIKN